MIDRIAFIVLAVLVFTIPWEKSVTIAGIGTLSKAIGALALLAGAGGAATRRSVRAPNFAMLLAALFVLWSALTWLWSYDRSATVERSVTYIQLLILAYLVWDLARSRTRSLVLLAAYVAGAVVASAATIVRYTQNLQTYYRRYAAPGFDPNDLGLTVALAIPIALYLAHRQGGWAAWLMRAAIAFICVAILLTASRTSLIVAYLGFGFAVWTWKPSSWSQRLASIGLAALLTAGAVQLAPKATRQRISTLRTEITKGTLHDRTRIWKAGLKAIKSSPIGGVGAAAYPDAVKPTLGVPPIPGHEYVAHNAFLSVLVETGIIGFVLFGSTLLVLGLFALVMNDPERALWIAVLLVWAAGVSTLTWEHRKPTWLLFALLMTQWAQAFAPPKPGPGS